MTDASSDALQEQTALYRLFGSADELLYIGISSRFGQRWREHARAQPWWPEVERQTVDWFASRELAAAAEAQAIKSEGPRYNVVHAPRDSPPRVREVFLVAYEPGCGLTTLGGGALIAPGQYEVSLSMQDGTPSAVVQARRTHRPARTSTARAGTPPAPVPPAVIGELMPLLRSVQGTSVRRAARALGVPATQAWQWLTRLRYDGVAEIRGEGRGASWHLVQDGD